MRDAVRQAGNDPAGLEQLYRRARRHGEAEAFGAAIRACAAEAPENLLYRAWGLRLEPDAPEAPDEEAAEPPRRWGLALGLSVACGMLLAVLANGEVPVPVPGVATSAFWIGWSPLAALAIIAFLSLAGTRPERTRFHVGAAAAVVGVGALAALVAWGRTDDAAKLVALHLPFLAWAAIGGAVTLGRAGRDRNVYAHTVQSLETLVAAGLFVASGMVFTGLTLGLLAVFDIQIPDAVLQVAAAFGIGLVPVLAVAATHDPTAAPASQPRSGVARLLRIMAWLALPVALVVLAVYVFWLIPTNFGRAFEEREVLLVYNATIIAILVALFAASSIVGRAGESDRFVRSTVLAVMGLTALLNLYALAANLSRILEMGLTTNRHAVLGWNVVTLAMLGFLLARLWSGGGGDWLPRFRGALGRALALPIVWALWVVVVVPLL